MRSTRAEASNTGSSGWDAAAVGDLQALCTAEGCVTARDERLGRHTSIGVGGPTPLMVWPRHPQAVGAALEWCARRGLDWRVLGGGTNVLVSDRGVDEPVLNLTALTDGVRIETPTTVFPAGVTTAQAMKATIRAGLRSLVWAAGLPGTIGGAAAGNAGCWDGQMADVVERLEVIDTAGAWHTLSTGELRWAYRSPPLPESVGPGAVIVAVALDMRPGDPDELQRRADELHAAKRQRQPIGARNAGCIFKNPEPANPAGRLIDAAGCKGLRVGDAEISELHGNFLVNHGAATCADVDELIEAVTRAVRERSGHALEEEIQRW